MPTDPNVLRDWHRLFGVLLTDFFTNSPFTVDIERDLSQQQQFLDVVILRRGRGRFVGQLPDGLEGLVDHNLITFKSHHEALDPWAMKELIGHYVAYRKLVSPSPNELLPEPVFRLYAVCARFPSLLSGQVPWHQRQAGVYDCQWGTDVVRVVVAGELPQAAQNAPLHLFSASPELTNFGRRTYQQRSQHTSRVLKQLLEEFQREGFAMSYTMEDFEHDYIKSHFAQLTPEEQQEAVKNLPRKKKQELLKTLLLEEQRAGLTPQQLQEYLDPTTSPRPAPRKPRRKK